MISFFTCRHGYAKWRDPQKPTQILTKLCKDEGLDGPIFDERGCTVQGLSFVGDLNIKDSKGAFILFPS